MGLVEIMNAAAGSSTPQPIKPVLISCDWPTLPRKDRMQAVVQLVKFAKFQAEFIGANEAYVTLTRVYDQRTTAEFFDHLLEAYEKNEGYLQKQTTD